MKDNDLVDLDDWLAQFEDKDLFVLTKDKNGRIVLRHKKSKQACIIRDAGE